MRTIANKTARSHQAEKSSSDEPLVEACWPAFLRCLRAVAASGNNSTTTQQRLPQLQAGLEKTRVKKNTSPVFFFVSLYICPEESF
jgi:hypothetical protein